jgi:hypothetical protein
MEAIRSSGILELDDGVSPVEVTRAVLEAVAKAKDDTGGRTPPLIISVADGAGSPRAAMLAMPFASYPDDIAISPVYWADRSSIRQFGSQRRFHATFIALALNALREKGYRGLLFDLRPRSLRKLVGQMPFTVLSGDEVIAGLECRTLA